MADRDQAGQVVGTVAQNETVQRAYGWADRARAADGPDDLVDAVLRSVDGVARAAGICNPQKWLRPVLAELIGRARDFGYEDEAIHAILVRNDAHKAWPKP